MEICDWIEDMYPTSVAGKDNWRGTVSASLSSDPRLLKCNPRWGEKAAVWKLRSKYEINESKQHSLGPRSCDSINSDNIQGILSLGQQMLQKQDVIVPTMQVVVPSPDKRQHSPCFPNIANSKESYEESSSQNNDLSECHDEV